MANDDIGFEPISTPSTNVDSDDIGFEPISNNFTNQQTTTPKTSKQTQIPSGNGGNVISNSFKRAGIDTLAGLANLGQGILNVPHNVSNVFSPSFANKYFPEMKNDYSAMLGMPNPSLQDQIAQGIVQYSPFAATGAGLVGDASGIAAKAAGQGLGGMAYGLSQPGNPLQNVTKSGLIGAGTEGASNVAGNVLSKVAQPVKNYLTQFAAPGIVDKILSVIKNDSKNTNANAFNVARENYEDTRDSENQKWQALKPFASIADKSPDIKYNNSSYVNSLENHASNLKRQSANQSGFNRANKDSIELLEGNNSNNGYLDDKHNSFSDAIEHNQALNRDFSNEITPGKSLPFETIKYARKNLKSNFQNNLSQNGLDPTLGALWRDANSTTENRIKDFHQVVNNKGVPKNSSFLQFYKNGSDPSSFVQDYLPTAKNDGTQKMQQFGRMMGNEDYGKSVLRQNLFNSENPNNFLKQYDKLSSEQQNYLFNPDQNNAIQALKKIIKISPNALGKVSNFQKFVNHAIPTMFALSAAKHGAGGLAHMLGEGATDAGALALGGLTSGVFNKGLRNLASTNPLQNYLIRAINFPHQGNFLNSVFNKVKNPILQGSIVPNS